MLCHLHLLPPAPGPGPVAARLGPLRTLWPAPGALFAELERELLRELETAREFASSMGQLVAGGGSGSPGGEPGQSSSAALAQGTAEPFAVRQDVRGFAPQELAVKLVGRKVLLTGRKETQSEDSKGSFSYKYEVFKREWDVPEAVDTDRLTCSISKEGQLCIEAPCLAPPAIPARNVPIQLSPAGGSAAPAEQGSEDGANSRAQG
ncbi:heat shock protein 30C-like [Dermochelys coriacea]|uniref:heat shock protein 30C-like n=1 Tax=Dermochelys coriacea TaxID=27794 RepID=UPI0018E75F77|nr:heat shock protein 30C-like [Dermochelys coriacea]